MNEKPMLRVIAGATASGKSALALELAEKLNGEIVSVDSMQLYRGLEIGTAQPTATERERVTHHLVGIYDYNQRADVYSYCRMADEVIAGISRRGKTPILVGGTGFYLRALLYGLDDLPADTDLRAELNAKYDSESGETALHALMAKLDPVALEKWGKCRRRLIRALEVRTLTGKSLLELQSASDSAPRYNFRYWVLDRPPEVLKIRIRARAKKMLANGWIEEAATAIAQGLLTSPTAHQAIGYKLIGDYLRGELAMERLEDLITTATWQFARRQRTWFHTQVKDAVYLSEPSEIYSGEI